MLALPLRAARLTLLVLIATLGAAHARVHWGTPGAYRLRVGRSGPVPGAPTGRNLIVSHRLRIEPTVEVHAFWIHTQLDVLTGQIAGDTTTLGSQLGERRHGDPERSTDGWTTVQPRLLEIRLRLDWVEAWLGQIAPRWGLGLIDGDGADGEGPDGLVRFGDRNNGDIFQRAAVEFRPGWRALNHVWRGFAVGAGADRVYQDEGASLLDNDSAWRAFGTVRWAGEALELGVWAVHREQTDREQRPSSTTTIDGFIRAALPAHGLRATVHLAAEGAVQTDGALGVLTRSALRWSRPRLAVGLDAGYASGGAEPFRFDPDVRVGLILFGTALRQLSMAAAEADPQALAPDPRPTDGAVTDAIFLYPLLTWYPEAWRLSAGVLAAWTADGEHSGLEFDIGMHRLFGFGALGMQAGMLLPGSALIPGRAPAPIAQVTGRFDLRW